MPDGIKYAAKFTSIKRAVQANRRGAILPFFVKQDDYRAHSPHETKKSNLRVFPVLAEIYRKEKEPKMGIFPLKIQTLLFPLSSTGDKWGRVHSFTLLFFYDLILDLLSGKNDHRHSSARIDAAPDKIEVFVFLAFLGRFEAFVFSLI